MITALFLFCSATLVADAVTTVIGFRRGFKETNRLMPQTAEGVLALLGLLLLGAMMLYMLCDERQDPWLAVVTLGVIGAIKLYCAVANARRLWWRR